MREGANLRRGAVRVRGFTVIEAMNLVTVLVLLGIVSMVVFATYKRHNKTSEAMHVLASLGKAAARYYDESDPQPGLRAFPPSSRASVPASVDTVRGKRYRSAAADWTGPPWKELGFSIEHPQYFAYSFESQGSGPQARAKGSAEGDLDGDGTTVIYAVKIAPDETMQARAGAVEKVKGD